MSTEVLEPDTVVLGEGELDQGVAEHRLLGRIASFSMRRRKLVLAVWLAVVLAAAPLALTLTGALSGAGWEAQGSIAQSVRDELRHDFPQVGAEAAVVVVQQATPIADDPAVVDLLELCDLTGYFGDPLLIRSKAD